MEGLLPIKNALISVSDKTGLADLVRRLHAAKVRLFATGGTHKFLESELGTTIDRVEDLTRFPEMMDGRVKTLHPKVFGGILARREVAKDLEEAAQFEIPLFDLVIVNLYPFGEHLGKSHAETSSFVDIGGPSLLRASSKNCVSVTVLSDPSDYAAFIEELDRNGGASTTFAFRKSLAVKTFQRTSAYDAQIAAEWGAGDLPAGYVGSTLYPLRYGENPHQRGQWVTQEKLPWRVLQGKELSYNNLLDAHSALALALEFKEPCAVIVKHNSPCGVSAGEVSLSACVSRALKADEKSAFGGIVAVNRLLDLQSAEALKTIFLEVVVAPSFEASARDLLSEKKNLRLVEWPSPALGNYEFRSAFGGCLVQERDARGNDIELKAVTEKKITPALEKDLRFAWSVCKHLRSNAIVLARDGVTLGMGGGQVSRVDAVALALQKSPADALRGAVLASDAFFPFRDNIDLLKATGISAIIQPGGSQRDPEVIQACNEQGIAMVFTGVRHFRH